MIYVKEMFIMGREYNSAQKRAILKYLSEKTDSIQIRVPKGKKEEYKKRAAEQGLSLTAYIVKLLEADQ